MKSKESEFSKPSWIVQYPELVFVILASGFGVLFILLVPPFQAPDEYAHFYRAYQISEGRMVAEIQEDYIGGYLPESLLATALGVTKGVPYPFAIGVSIDTNYNIDKKLTLSDYTPILKLPVNSQKRVFLAFPNTASYSPVPYLPHQLGFMIGRLFNLSPILQFYIARAFNLFVWIGLMFFSIKAIPILKYVFLLLALTPMSLFIASTLSADTFTNAIAYLIISVFIRFAYDNNREIRMKDIFILFVLSTLLSLSKQGYYLLLFLFFLIPADRFSFIADNKYRLLKYLIVFLALIIINLSLIMLWSSIVRDIVMLPQSYSPNMSAHDQLSLILSHPLTYCRTILNTFIRRHFYLDQLIGVLGWLDTRMPTFILYSYFIVLVTTSFIEKDKHCVISKFKKVLIFSIMILTILLINTLAYLLWTPVGSESIDGIQGRYFIPIFPLAMLLLYNAKIANQCINIKGIVFDKHLKVIEYIRNNNIVFHLSVVSYSVFTLSLTLSILFRRYWV
ncbi:MAG: DUF2142 domain-containing protein [Nitrospirae bacterium]|nr:DUF2142 domain-containing protein [Nitrospirota bacterium]